MNDKDDGGPAFPQTPESWERMAGHAPVPSGMSLRDWFAGMALQGIIAATAVPTNSEYPHDYDAARRAYEYADAMIAERSKER